MDPNLDRRRRAALGVMVLGCAALLVALIGAMRVGRGDAAVDLDGAVDLPGDIVFTATAGGTRSISYSLAGEYRSRSRVRVDSLDCRVSQDAAASGSEIPVESVGPTPVAQQGDERTWFEHLRFEVRAGGRYTVTCRTLPAALGNVPVRIGVGPTPEGTGLGGPWSVVSAGAALTGVALLVGGGLRWRRRAGEAPALT